MLTPERVAEFHRFAHAVTAWGVEQDDIRVIAAVGSWARGQAHMDSDLDLVIITVDKHRYLSDNLWVADAVGQDAQVVARAQDWGALTERRVVLSSGFEI